MKPILSWLLTLSLLLFCATAVAEETPVVTIQQEASHIPETVVAQLIAAHPEAQELLIRSWKTAVLPEGNAVQEPIAAPTLTAENVLLEDCFLTSCAKYTADATLSEPFTRTFRSTVTATQGSAVTPGQLRLRSGVTFSVPTWYVFDSLPEDAACNSSTFWVAFFQNEGTWVSETGSGTWTEPTHYVEYTVNLLIAP